MSKYIKLIFLIQISKILSQIFSLYETVNDSKIYYSSGLETKEIEKQIFNPKFTNFQDTRSDLIEVDLKIPNIIEFYHNNLDYATGYPLITTMIFENNIFGLNNISMNYFHDDHVFYPQNVIYNTIIPLKVNINNDLFVNCSYYNMNYKTYLFEYSRKIKPYRKSEFFLQFTFGLYENYIYYLNGNNDEILLNISECTGNVIDFFINYKVGINNKEGYLFIYNSNKNICIISIAIQSNSLQYNYINSINNINSKLNDIKSYDDYIYYSIEGDYSIHQISINETSKIIFNYTNNIIENDIISFVVTNDLIYLIVKGIGLCGIHKKNSSLIEFLEFPYAFKLDYFISPFNGNKFIGLYNNNTDNKYSDFFIEFFINDNNILKLNKALLYPDSNKPIIRQIITFDYYFTYIYDIKNKQIIMIKRGSQFNIPFSSFKIDLSNYTNNYNSLIFPIYFQRDTIKINLLDDNKLYIIDGEFISGNLTCSFNKIGIYHLIFTQIQDFCTDTFYKIDSICHNFIVYRFNVLSIKNNKLIKNLFLSFSTIFILLLVVIIAYLLRKKDNYKKNINFKDNKKYLYEDIGDINNKNNNKNQNVGELDGNKEKLINNNFGGINENFLNNILKNNKKREKQGYNPHKSEIEIINKIEKKDNNIINENEKKNDNIICENTPIPIQKIEIKRTTFSQNMNNNLEIKSDKKSDDNDSNN